jgi:histidine triad (HIT) family protein
MAYDNDNIFAKILRGEIPCRKVVETEHTLAFEDIQPQAPTHVLVIPKGAYVDHAHFAAEASDAELVDFTRTVGRVARESGASEEGFRLIANSGRNAHQDVPHYHMHVLGGRRLGPMLPREG